VRASLAIALLATLAAPAVAQQRIPGTGVPATSCGPSNSSEACQELRQAAPGGRIQGLVAPRLQQGLPEPLPLEMAVPKSDTPNRRIIPPSIARFLNDRRIDPATRSFLFAIANKPNNEWTLEDLQMVSGVVPTLAEMRIPAATLREFYEYLGLDPNRLFEPQIGGSWQVSSTLNEPRNYARVRAGCIDLQRTAQRDPSSVRVEELLACVPPQ